jgi:hypothetical protein
LKPAEGWGLGGATIKTLPGAFGMGGDIPGYHAFFIGIQDTKFVMMALATTVGRCIVHTWFELTVDLACWKRGAGR